MQERQVIRALEKHLEKEIKIYQQYFEILVEQKRWLTKFKAEKMTALNERRAKLTQQMQEMHEKRLEILQVFPESSGMKLTDIISHYCQPADRTRLMPLAEKLKGQIHMCQATGNEFSHVVQFALNMVNGSLSLIGQATQNVSKKYDPQGKISESYNPTRSRKETVLKEA